MNPERAAQHNIDRETRSDDIVRTTEKLLTGYSRVRDYLDKVSIKPESLTDYNSDTVRKDLDYVAKRKKQMTEEDGRLKFGNITGIEVKQLADVLEYQLYRGINEAGWMPFCRAIKTSEFDDIANGVDIVVEYANKEQFGHLGLAVDVTFSQNLAKKFNRIKNEIDNYDGMENRLAEVKYFNSEKSGISGRLFGIPRVVTAIDTQVMLDLSKDIAKNNRPLPNHAAKHSIIIEILHQLETYKKYAEKYNPKCLPQLTRAWAFVKVISEKLESEKKLIASEYRKNERIQQAVEDGLRIFR